MMIIADSGATRTQWAIVSADGAELMSTSGLNPYFAGKNEFDEATDQVKKRIAEKRVKNIYFYGSGCGNPEKADWIRGRFESSFSGCNISIATDLLGTARGIFGSRQGIACILGTGSNAGYYDGNSLTRTIASLGFIFGDEGSGANLGKELITWWLKGLLPFDLDKSFVEVHGDIRLEILNKVYNQPRPSAYLAGFCTFIHRNKKHPWIIALLHDAFSRFVKQVLPLQNEAKDIPLGFSGSVALYFKEELTEICQEYSLEVNEISGSPLEGLISFHKESHKE